MVINKILRLNPNISPNPIPKVIRFSTAVLISVLAFFVSAEDASGKYNRFAIRENTGEVLDTKTKLIWRRCTEGQAWDGAQCRGGAAVFSWEDAQVRAKNISEMEGVAWRVPEVGELKSLIGKNTSLKNNAWVDLEIFPESIPDWYWTSTVYSGDEKFAWVVDFFTGTWGYDLKTAALGGALRLVRSAN